MNYESDFDEALVKVCTLASIPASKIRSTERLKTPFVEVLFELGPALEHLNADREYDVFGASLSFSVHTDRDRNPERHNENVTEIRRLMSKEFRCLVQAEFPSYKIFEIVPDGSTYDIVDDLDVTELRFRMTFQVV